MSNITNAKAELDKHVQDMMQWHFSPETGCAFWLNRVKELRFDPRKEIQGFDDLVERFPFYDGKKYLTQVPAEQWQPKGLPGGGWSMWETGGTTADPKCRWGLSSKDPTKSDVAWDYHTFSGFLPKQGFPNGGCILHIGPGGPRRLPLGVEILADIRNAGFIRVDMDVAYMKDKNNPDPEAYKQTLFNRAARLIKRHKPKSVFCPPILVEGIGTKLDWTETGIQGVFAGGTEMDPKKTQHIMEELFQGKIEFVPTYGNALVGLARHRPIATLSKPIDGQKLYSITYQPLQPHTVLRVVDPNNPRQLVPYGERGVVVVTTLTREWLMPLLVERDEAGRVPPTEEYPWDGVNEVGPNEKDRETLNEGVY